MAFPQGIDFRATSGFVTDPTGCAPEIGTSVNYPRTTAQGNMVGWETINNVVSTRDRSASVDARLAGIAFAADTNANTDTYRIDLPATGSYIISAAVGDQGSNQFGQNVEFFDGTTSLGKAASNQSTSAAQFYDATDVLRTSVADWVSNNATLTASFATTIFRTKIGGGSGLGVTTIAHINIAASGGGFTPVNRRTLSSNGTRTGTRQLQGAAYGANQAARELRPHLSHGAIG